MLSPGNKNLLVLVNTAWAGKVYNGVGLSFYKGHSMRACILAVFLTACAAKPPEPYLTLEQLRKYTVTQADCARQDQVIALLERNQLRAGIPQVPPEQLLSAPREYQALTRNAIWALRIGCANPDRHAH